MKRSNLIILVSTMALYFLFATSTFAFTITGELTGDIRFPDNPANLIVDVTIDVNDGTNSTDNQTAFWTVDINSPLHPFIKLDAFYFNLKDLLFADLVFSDFNPNNWSVTDDTGNNANGSGNMDFMFEADRTPPGGDVTNDVSLTFTMSLMDSMAEFTEDNFLGAVISTGDAGSGQLGAHLQSLSVPEGFPGMSDSGFATGMYEGDVRQPPSPNPPRSCSRV